MQGVEVKKGKSRAVSKIRLQLRLCCAKRCAEKQQGRLLHLARPAAPAGAAKVRDTYYGSDNALFSPQPPQLPMPSPTCSGQAAAGEPDFAKAGGFPEMPAAHWRV